MKFVKTILFPLYRVYNWPIRKLFSQKSKFQTKNLLDKHISNAKLLENRLSLLEKLPKNGTIAEIGVDIGLFSEVILKTSNPQKFFLIDNWSTFRYNKTKEKLVHDKFKFEIQRGLIEIKVTNSAAAATSFGDDFFDWIYLDTDHSYESTKMELAAFAPKIKKTGFIAGHDYNSGSWIEQVKYGVIEAVHEFCVSHNWELIYLTVETDFPRSFAIRRLA